MSRILLWLVLGAVFVCVHSGSGQGMAREFTECGELVTGFPVCTPTEFGELVHCDTLLGSVSVVVVSPPPSPGDLRKPTRLIIYALPNGNTIEQTMGKRVADSVHWRFGIQHIAGQTRLMRSVAQAWNIVVAYVEAEGLSWPRWKREHHPAPVLLQELVDTLRARVRGNEMTVTLTGHSGGGSFIFGLMDSWSEIPAWVDRISFLDSNYGFDTTAGHGRKLSAWLGGGEGRSLSIIAYDDREITLDGKKVLGPDGGTYRRTLQMVEDLSREFEMRKSRKGDLLMWHATNCHLEVIIHENPENKILHTRLVERNGFLRAMLFGTPYEQAGGEFWGEPAYRKWISGCKAG